MFQSYSNGDLIHEIDEEGEHLTQWEIDFVDDLVTRMRATADRRKHTGEDFPLSPKQRARLELIGADRLPPR